MHNNAEIRFRVEDDDGDTINNARIFVGHYEARVSPIADTNPATTGLNLDDVAEFAPGTYELLAQAPGYGFLRGGTDLPQGRGLDDRVPDADEPRVHDAGRDGLRRRGRGVPGPAADRGPARHHPGHPAAGPEHAHRRHGADQLDGGGHHHLASPGNLSVDGKQATIDLAGTEPVRIRHIQVSSMLRSGVVATPGLANSSQNRFTALRQFEVWACNGRTARGTAGSTKVYTSRADAFPGDPPRPVAPHMILREFDIPNTWATHLRLVAKTSQCTGGPAFQGEQDADPTNNTDCDSNVASVLSRSFVRAAEFQAFSAGRERPAVAAATTTTTTTTTTRPRWLSAREWGPAAGPRSFSTLTTNNRQ